MASTYFSKRIKADLKQKARGRKRRPRTFKTEAAAKAWAKARGIATFELVNLRSKASTTKKLRIAAK